MSDKIDVEVDFGYDEEEEEVPKQPLVQNGSSSAKAQQPASNGVTQPEVGAAQNGVHKEPTDGEFLVPDAQAHLNARAAEDQKVTAGEIYVQELAKKKAAMTAAVEGEQAQVHEKIKEIPDVYSFDFDRPGLEKPWNINAERNDEYFNYGM